MNVKRYEWVACDEHSCHCDVVESAEGDMVDYEDYAALEARCAALAAENAGLKNQLRELFNSCDTGERRGNGSLSGAAVPDWCVLEKTRQFLESAPATDAFLAEVRAQGVEMFAAYCGEENSVFIEAKAYYRSLPDAVAEFATQLRKGVQS